MSTILRIPPRRIPPATSKMDLDMPQIMTINQAAAPSSEPDFEEEYVEYVTDEEEVDQIIDDEPPPTARKTNGKCKQPKATNLTPSATPGPAEPPLAKFKLEKALPPLPPRQPGETHIDQQRVEKIIKAHGDMLPPSRDAVFLISLAVEEFVKRLAETGRRHAMNEHRASIDQCDMALAAQIDRGYAFLRETVPTAIPLSLALQKHAQKENERTLIATELIHPSHPISNGTATHSHKKRQPPLAKPPAAKAKTRTSARQANGRSSVANASAASTSASIPVSVSASASAHASAADATVTNPHRPKRAAAQRGRGSWAQADGDGMEYDEEETDYTTPMDTDDPLLPWHASSRQSLGNAGTGRGGIMKGFGPGAYGRVGGLVGRPTTPPRMHNAWVFPQEPPRNTGRTIYSDRTDEEARKAAVELEEQLRYMRARQKIEQELITQEVAEPSSEWTSEKKD